MTQFLAYLDAHPWAMWIVGTVVAGLFSLVVSKRSQIDEWAESNPTVAGIMKILRGLGIDPWLVFQGVALIVLKRLPATKPTRKPPVLPLLMVACLGLSGCANWKPAARTVSDVARDLCSLFFAEKQGISIEQAADLACDTRDKLDPWIREVLAAKQTAGAAASK